MFDDLIENKKSAVEKCPFCGSYSISKGSQKITIDDKYEQSAHCFSCNRDWRFVYNEDRSSAGVINITG